MHYLIILFLSCCLVSIFYWHVIQPVLLRVIRFRLFEKRDQLRRLAIESKEDHTSFAYRGVESLICKTLAVIPAVSFISFIWFAVRNVDKKDENVERLRKEASPLLLEIAEKTVSDALFIMALNSPIMILFAAFIALCLWVVGCINKLAIYQKTEDFIDDLPNDFANDRSGIPQAA